MKRIIAIFVMLHTLAFAQTPDTLTPEKNARWKIGRIRDNTIRAITPADFRNAFNSVANLAVSRTPYMSMKEVRAGKADTSRVVYVNEPLLSGEFVFDAADTSTPDDSAMTIRAGSRRYKRRFDGPIYLEWFGAKGDYNYQTATGTEDTKAIQKAINYAASKGYEIKLNAGRKYLTDAIYAYYDATLNAGYPSKPGRLKISGGASGIATGSQEPQGSALVHKNGSAKPLFDCRAVFTIENPGNTGGHLDFQNVNFIGGNHTTDVIYLELTVGQTSLKNLTVQVNNPAGNGITENNTWEGTMENILIRGQATGDGTWTGIGLNIKTNESGGQVNMKVYNNVDAYKNGYNIRIGRRTASIGTLAPLVFIGGQCSLADHHNMWIDGGVYNLVSIGQQFEGSRLNALHIDSDGATDLPRNLKFINPYFTGGGRIEDGSYNSYAVHIVDGEGVSFEAPLFNNLGNGIVFDQSKCQGLVIERPVIRTVRAYGTASGTFISAYGTNNTIMRHRLIDPVFNQTPATTVAEPALTSFLRTESGSYVSLSGNSTTPSISLGGGILQRARNVNFNNSSPTTVTNIMDGQYLREVHLTSGNSNTTIASNGNIFLAGGQDFKFTNRSTLTLVWLGTYWQEVSRSDFNNIIQLPKSVSLNGSSTSILIAHGLGVAPTYFNAVATNAAAAGVSYVSADATNIIINYASAPAAGTGTYNVSYRK